MKREVSGFALDIAPYIVGGVLGGMAIAGTVIVLSLMILKDSKGHKTYPIQHVSPLTGCYTLPPSKYDQTAVYSITPPPPYIYTDKVNGGAPANETKHSETLGIDQHGRRNDTQGRRSIQRRIEKMAMVGDQPPTAIEVFKK